MTQGNFKPRFDWDLEKARSNLKKHGVAFPEALTVFVDPTAKIMDDEDHSNGEHREIIVGYSERKRLLIVSFVQRGELIRIISARKATRKEREVHEENIDG